MEAKVSIDVGDNITKMIEKLATTIGTTTEKVFPWYVKQVQVEGYAALFLLVVFILLVLALFSYVVFSKKPLGDDINTRWIVLIVACLTGFFVMFGLAVEFTEICTDILNPEKRALSNMINDISRLVK